MSAYCEHFYLDSKAYPNDRRKGCCGICTKYDYDKGKCKIATAVIAWAKTVKHDFNKEP
jgi:hypothetical protein